MPVHCTDLSVPVESIRAECTANARSCFEDCLAWVLGPAQALYVHEASEGLFGRLMALGCALMALWLAMRVPTTVPNSYQWAGSWYTLCGLTPEVVRLRYGAYRWFRPTYERTAGTAGPDTIAPVERAIGLADGRMTLDVHLLAAWLASKFVFDDVVEVMNRFGSYAPSKKTVLGIVDQLGPHGLEYLADLPVPVGDGEWLVMQADEKGVGMMSGAEHTKRSRPHKKRRRGEAKRTYRRRQRRELPRVRRKKGDKSKNARMSTVGVVYTLKRNRHGQIEGPVNKRVIATFGRERLFELMHRHAVRRGLDAKKSWFLADGAKDLWSLQRAWFPKSTACVDWCHVDEYLWKAGTARFKEGSEPLKDWIDARRDELRRDDVDAVLVALNTMLSGVSKTGPGNKGRRKRVTDAIRYITNQKPRLRYGELLAIDMDIATGMVEGAVNYVVGRRLDGSMMRWSQERANYVLALRCALVNGDWAHLEARIRAAHATRTEPFVSRITPDHSQKPYDAVRKAA